jgi:hypothetical protein
MKNLIKNFLGRIDKKYNRPDARDNYLEKIELSYLYNMFNIFRDIENCPGHIIELGVGAGRNAIILGNLLKTTGQNGSSRYFGFDSFKSYTARDLQIEKGLNPEKWENNSYDFVSNRIKKHNLDDVSLLIEGDIRETLPKFVASKALKKSPNTLFCRLIYIDTSAYEPSILGLDLLWKHVVPGGLVIIDQRTQGGEWRAAIEFCEKNKIKPKGINAFNSAPIYLKKE